MYMENLPATASDSVTGASCCIGAGEAIDADIPIAVCSTSNERAVTTIVRVMLGDKVNKVPIRYCR